MHSENWKDVFVNVLVKTKSSMAIFKIMILSMSRMHISNLSRPAPLAKIVTAIAAFAN